MSSQIRAERKTYYETLEATQKGTLDVTPWLRWFLACLDRAFDRAETILGTVLQKARIWETHSAAPLNERQRAILNRLLDGFEGILAKNEGGGRSTSYALVLPPYMARVTSFAGRRRLERDARPARAVR